MRPLPYGGDVTLPVPEELHRARDLDAIGDLAFTLARDLHDVAPTRDALGPLVVLARQIATELAELRDSA